MSFFQTQITNPVTTPINPLALTFTNVVTTRLNGELDDRLMLLSKTAESDFIGNSDLVVTNASGTTQTSAWVNDALQITKTGTGTSLLTFNKFPRASFWCVEITLESFSAGGTGTFADLCVGIFKDNVAALNAVFGTFSLIGGAQSGQIYFNTASGYTSSMTTISTNPTSGTQTKLYACCTGDYLFLGRKVGSTITWGHAVDLSLSGNRPGNNAFFDGTTKFGILLSDNYSGNKVVNISSVKASYFKGHGIADWSPICWDDAEPMIIDKRVYYIASRKGQALENYGTADQSTLAIYSMGLLTNDVRSEGLIFINRGGVIEGDFSPYLIRDKNTLQWRLLSPSWGHMKNFIGLGSDVTMAHVVTSNNVLSGIHIFADNPLQIRGQSNYDPCIYKHTDGYYYICYSVNDGTNFVTYLDKTLDWVTFTSIPISGFAGNSEGQKFVKINKQVYIYVGIENNTYEIYTIGGVRVGAITAGIPSGLVQAGHPCIIPYNKNGRTYFKLITMDTGTNSFFPVNRGLFYTNGSTYIYDCPQFEEGFEYQNSEIIQ